MNRDYWDSQVDRWDAEIFNSLSEDVHGLIRGAIGRAARRHGDVIDFGCGVGGYLASLARSFDKVHAIDWSAECVERAAARTTGRPNVTVERNTPRVLSRLKGKFGCVLAANVVIHPDGRIRRALWRAIRSVVERGGDGIFVVPSLESAAYCEFVRRETAPRQGTSYDFHLRTPRAEAGAVGIEGVPTKHYTAEELNGTLDAIGFRILRLSRVNYAWSTERLSPHRRMGATLPWDWLIEARAT
ncbi:MAG TPA: methyltransferase domain-containing protein [Gemmatimonadaceae bacterium]